MSSKIAFERLAASLVERIATARMAPELVDVFVHAEASILPYQRRADLSVAVHDGLVAYAADMGISAIDYRAALLAMNMRARHISSWN